MKIFRNREEQQLEDEITSYLENKSYHDMYSFALFREPKEAFKIAFLEEQEVTPEFLNCLLNYARVTNDPELFRHYVTLIDKRPLCSEDIDQILSFYSECFRTNQDSSGFEWLMKKIDFYDHLRPQLVHAIERIQEKNEFMNPYRYSDFLRKYDIDRFMRMVDYYSIKSDGKLYLEAMDNRISVLDLSHQLSVCEIGEDHSESIVPESSFVPYYQKEFIRKYPKFCSETKNVFMNALKEAMNASLDRETRKKWAKLLYQYRKEIEMNDEEKEQFLDAQETFHIEKRMYQCAKNFSEVGIRVNAWSDQLTDPKYCYRYLMKVPVTDPQSMLQKLVVYPNWLKRVIKQGRFVELCSELLSEEIQKQDEVFQEIGQTYIQNPSIETLKKMELGAKQLLILRELQQENEKVREKVKCYSQKTNENHQK